MKLIQLTPDLVVGIPHWLDLEKSNSDIGQLSERLFRSSSELNAESSKAGWRGLATRLRVVNNGEWRVNERQFEIRTRSDQKAKKTSSRGVRIFFAECGIYAYGWLCAEVKKWYLRGSRKFSVKSSTIYNKNSILSEWFAISGRLKTSKRPILRSRKCVKSQKFSSFFSSRFSYTVEHRSDPSLQRNFC